MNKVKPENSFNVCQKPRIWINYIMSLKKYNLSKIYMEQSVEPNFFKRWHQSPYFVHVSDFFFLKRFLRKSSKLGHGNLVIITSTVQVGLSKWNFNFHDIKTYFFQVLRDRRQITVVTLNGSCLLSKKKNPPPSS